MQRLLGPRTIVEAVFLVAVPVVAVVAGSGTWTIVGASAVAYLLVLVAETTFWREARGGTAPSRADVPVLPVVAPPLVPSVPAPVVETAGPADPVEPSPEPPPPPVERPALTALPTLPPPPPPELPEIPEPEPANVVPLGVGPAPREWSLWELERIAREHTGDPVHDEERRFLLMYLRDFADADGQLPVDFDALVRDSFGDLLGR